MFTKSDDTGVFTAVVTYVDDLLVTGNSLSSIQSVKKSLHEAFTIKDLGQLKYFLGIEVSRNSSGILLNQRKYILDLLRDHDLENCKPASFPLPRNLHLSTEDGPSLSDPEVYRRLIGKLLYLNMTRPDISFAVQHLSQFIQAPAAPHLTAAMHVLHYLKGTINTGLFYRSQNDLSLKAYCDSDWDNCIFSAKSVSGYAIFLGDSLISWKTKKQKTTSKSSCEAEYRCMSYTTSEIIWLHGLLADLQISIPTPIDLFCDNLAAQYIAENHVFQERTKHLRVDCHFIRDYVISKFINILHVRSALQLADLMTKALGADQHRFLCLKLGLVTHSFTSPA